MVLTLEVTKYTLLLALFYLGVIQEQWFTGLLPLYLVASTKLVFCFQVGYRSLRNILSFYLGVIRELRFTGFPLLYPASNGPAGGMVEPEKHDGVVHRSHSASFCKALPVAMSESALILHQKVLEGVLLVSVTNYSTVVGRLGKVSLNMVIWCFGNFQYWACL